MALTLCLSDTLKFCLSLAGCYETDKLILDFRLLLSSLAIYSRPSTSSHDPRPLLLILQPFTLDPRITFDCRRLETLKF